jgi:hypothetical protein
MRLIAGVFIIFYSLACGAQTVKPTVNPTEDEEEAGQTTGATPATAQAPASNSITAQVNIGATDTTATASGETNAPPAPAKDPAKCVILRFSFDDNLKPEMAGGNAIPVVFKRKSASYLEGVPVIANSPRFVEGRSGKALLLESAYLNFFSIAQSSAEEINAFKPLNGAALSISSEQPYQGKEALAVTTKGENSEEGFSAETLVTKASYTKESAPYIVPVSYLASLYLKGQGSVKIMLKDVESDTSGEPVYAELSASWQRFSCVFSYSFQMIHAGASRETNWVNSIPPGTNINTHLQLICTTADKQKLNFFADGLQLEQRYTTSGKNPEFSPHSWVLGAFQTDQEQLTIDVKNDYFNAWEKTGSIAFWFKPLWEARDSSAELILQIANNQLNLSHNYKKIVLSPAGVSFTPYDWKNSWHHIVIAWNEAGEHTFYMDGMDYPNTSGQAVPLKDADSIMAGDFIKNLSPNGALDELTLYNITLNAEQVKVLASAEAKVEPAKSPESAPAPVATNAPTAISLPAATNQQPAAKQTPQEETEEE